MQTSSDPLWACVVQGSALALQQQRGFAEAAVATQTSVWDELSDLVSSDEGKRELATLRSTYADIAHKLTSMAKVGRGGAAGHWRRRFLRRSTRSRPLTLSAALRWVQDQPEINWQEWQKEIDPKLVQQFKQTYESEQPAGCRHNA